MQTSCISVPDHHCGETEGEALRETTRDRFKRQLELLKDAIDACAED
jgi:hypothetical protein